MSQTKFTQWRKAKSTPSLIEDTNGNTVAQAFEIYDGAIDKDRVQAMWDRAALISAAPDMLNALLDAKKHLEGYCFGDNQERTDVFNNITKAIVKATS